MQKDSNQQQQQLQDLPYKVELQDAKPFVTNNVFVGKSSIFGQPQTEQEIEDERCELELNKRRESLLASLEQLEEDVQLVVKSKQKSLYLQTRSQRGSKFRGVSKNGKKWQVMIVKGIAKKYLGAISNELRAAKLYDKYAMIIQGLQAKTNFSYTKKQITELLEDDDDQGADCQQQMTQQSQELNDGQKMAQYIQNQNNFQQQKLNNLTQESLANLPSQPSMMNLQPIQQNQIGQQQLLIRPGFVQNMTPGNNISQVLYPQQLVNLQQARLPQQFIGSQFGLNLGNTSSNQGVGISNGSIILQNQNLRYPLIQNSYQISGNIALQQQQNLQNALRTQQLIAAANQHIQRQQQNLLVQNSINNIQGVGSSMGYLNSIYGKQQQPNLINNNSAINYQL
eukprot:403349972